MRKSLFAFLLLLAGPALAQAPLVVRGLPYTGNGVMATSTASTAISGMTVSATGAALPSAFYNLYVINRGTTDVAFCPRRVCLTASRIPILFRQRRQSSRVPARRP